MRAASSAYLIADGPMSTPRRPAPRSRPAPMTATVGCVSGLVTVEDSRSAIGSPGRPERELLGARPVQLDTESAQLRSCDQVVELVGEPVHAGGDAAGSEMVDRQRLHREREVH